MLDENLVEVSSPEGIWSNTVNLLIFVPCYGGLTYSTSNDSIMRLMVEMLRTGVRANLTYGANESLIPRGRNRAANLALLPSPDGTPYSHLLFLDADIGFNAQDIFSMVGFNKDIVGLPYTAKAYDWEKIAKAVKNGVSPEKLPRCGGRPIINSERAEVFDPMKPLAVPQLGTGALLIKRKVLERFTEDPERMYKLMDGEKVGLPEGTEMACDFFQIGINKRTRYYDSEDYRFCLDAREMGFETWLLPWAVTSHTGPHTFLMDILMQAEAKTDIKEELEVSPA